MLSLLMKKQLFFLAIGLLFVKQLSAQQAPAIGWGDISSNTFGCTFKGVKSDIHFFTLEVSEGAGNRYIDINKYNNDGLLFSKRIYSDACSSCKTTGNIPFTILATPDGGAFVHYEINENEARIQKLDVNGDVVWGRSFSGMKFVNATITTNNLIYLIMDIKEGSLQNHYFLYQLSSIGTIAWSRDLLSFKPQSAISMADNGIIATSTDSTKRYNSGGVVSWKKDVGGSTLNKIDEDAVFIANATRYQVVNAVTGDVNWGKLESNVISTTLTSDNQIVVSTLTSLKKLNSSGVLQWQISATTGSQLFKMLNSEFAGIQGNTLNYYNSDGSLRWKKIFTYNSSNSLEAFAATDGGLFVLTRGNSPNASNLHGSAFLYRLLPENRLCDYSVLRTPTTDQTYCKTGTTTFTGNQQSLDINYGLPTTDYEISWQRDSLQYTTYPAFQTADVGTFQFKIKQGSCSVVSSKTTIKVIGTKKPTISSYLSELCLNTVSAKITAMGCPTTSKVVWSNSMEGDSILVKPTVTTDYFAVCSESYRNNGTLTTCLSESSNTRTITVLPTSNIIIRGIYGPNVICKDDTVLLDMEMHAFTIPVKFEWYKDGTLFSRKELSEKVTQAGNYQIRITDARGCTAETPIKILPKSLLDVNIVGNREYCQGTINSLQATASGGLGNITHSWVYEGGVTSTSPTVNTSSSGTYFLTVTDEKGCKKSAAAVVTQYPRILGAYQKTPVIKGNLQYIFNENTLTGGTKPFEVTLSSKSNTGEAVLINDKIVGPFKADSKIYVNVKDAKGCILSDSIAVDHIACDVAVKLIGDSTFCYKKTVEIKAETERGIGPFAYQWFRNDTLLSGNNSKFIVATVGNYKTVVTDSAQCQLATPTKKISEKGRDLRATITAAGDTTAYLPFTVKLNANTGTGYAYQWFKNDTLLASLTTPSIEAKTSGKYKVEVLQSGCSALSKPIMVTILTPLSNVGVIAEPSVRFYPNPTSDVVTISVDLAQAATAKIQLYDMQGKNLFQNEVKQTKPSHYWRVDASQWLPGAYMIRIVTPYAEYTGRLMKE